MENFMVGIFNQLYFFMQKTFGIIAFFKISKIDSNY